MNPLKTSQGFSLMELMVAMAVFSMIIAAIITARTDQQVQNITQIQAAEMQQSVRAVMFIMKQEIRMAGFNPYTTDYPGLGIATAGSTALTFSYVNTEVDPPVLKQVAYALSDDDLDGDSDDITLNGTVLAENIQNLTFRYFDGSSPVPLELVAPVVNPASIRSILISITAGIDRDELARGAATNRTRTLTSTVFLRNMGL